MKRQRPDSSLAARLARWWPSRAGLHPQRVQPGRAQASGEPVTEKTNCRRARSAPWRRRRASVKRRALGGLRRPRRRSTLNQLADDFNKSQDKVQRRGALAGRQLRRAAAASSRPVAGQQAAAGHRPAGGPRTCGCLVDTGDAAAGRGLPASRRVRLPRCSRRCGTTSPINDVFWPGYVDRVRAGPLLQRQTDFQKAGLDSTKPPRTLDELEKTARGPEEGGRSDKPPLALMMDSWFIEIWVNGAGASRGQQEQRPRRASPTKATFDNPGRPTRCSTGSRRWSTSGLAAGDPRHAGQHRPVPRRWPSRTRR